MVKGLAYRVALVLLTVLSVISLAGCSSERNRLMREKYPTYSESMQHAIDRGYLIRGMNHDQVYLALGEAICRKTIDYKGKPVEVWLFPPGGRDPCLTAEFRVYFEQGLVTRWDKFTGETRKTVPAGFVEP